VQGELEEEEEEEEEEAHEILEQLRDWTEFEV